MRCRVVMVSTTWLTSPALPLNTLCQNGIPPSAAAARPGLDLLEVDAAVFGVAVVRDRMRLVDPVVSRRQSLSVLCAAHGLYSGQGVSGHRRRGDPPAAGRIPGEQPHVHVGSVVRCADALMRAGS